MAIAVADILGQLKTGFKGPINKGILKEVALLNQIKFTNEHRIGGGWDIRHPIQLTRSTSVGFRGGSTEALPLPTPSIVKQATSTIKFLYAYQEFNGDGLRLAAREGPGAFASVFKFELDNLIMSSSIEVGRACYGDGSGELGEVETSGGTPASGIIKVRTSSTVDKTPNEHWFEVGQYLDIYAAANFAAGTATKLNLVNLYIGAMSTTGNVTTLTLYDAATNLAADLTSGSVMSVTATAGQKIVNKGNYMKEPYGLKAIIDNGAIMTNFLNISESSFPRWNANIVSAGSYSAFTEPNMQQLVNYAERFDKEMKDVIFMTDVAIRDKVANTVKTTMIQPVTLELKGGFKAISYGGRPLLADHFAPWGTIWAPHMPTIIPHQLDESKDGMFAAMDFDDIDNQVLHGTRNADVYWMKGVLSYNLTTGSRNKHSAYKDINPGA